MTDIDYKALAEGLQRQLGDIMKVVLEYAPKGKDPPLPCDAVDVVRWVLVRQAREQQ